MKTVSKSLIKLLILPISISLSGCNNKKEVKDMVKFVSDCVGSGEIETAFFPYEFDLKKMVEYDAESDIELAKLALMFCVNTVSTGKLVFKDSTNVAEDYKDYSVLYKELDLYDFDSVLTQDVKIDYRDGTLVNMAHKPVTIDDQKYDICFISFEDSSGDSGYWFSNFDIGDDVGYYDSITGEHPEWVNKNNHKGFDIASNRSLQIIESYISSNLDKNSQQILYVFGHSRGGAIANLTSAKLIDLGYKTCCYGFASPNTTTDKNASSEKYKTIHNYACKEDLITNILSSDLGFTRYGETISFSIYDYAKTYEKLNGFEIPKGDTSSIVNIFASLADSRDEIYKKSEKFSIVTSDPMNENDVQPFLDKYLKGFTGQFKELENYIDVSVSPVDDENGLVKVSINTCAGFYIALVGLVIADAITGKMNPMSLVTSFLPYFETLFKVTNTNISKIMGAVSIEHIAYIHYYQSYFSYAINKL